MPATHRAAPAPDRRRTKLRARGEARPLSSGRAATDRRGPLCTLIARRQRGPRARHPSGRPPATAPLPAPRLPAKATGWAPLLALRRLQAAAERRAALACALRKAAAAPAPGGGGREAARGSRSAALPGNGLSARPANTVFHILPPRRRDYISVPGLRPRAVGGGVAGAPVWVLGS